MKQKIVFKVQKTGSKGYCYCFSFGFILRKLRKEEEFQTKVLKKIAGTYGVQSMKLEGDARDKVVVTGANIDAVKLTKGLRKKVGLTSILSLEPVEEEAKEDKAEEHITPIGWSTSGYYPHYVYYQNP